MGSPGRGVCFRTQKLVLGNVLWPLGNALWQLGNVLWQLGTVLWQLGTWAELFAISWNINFPI